MKDIVLFGIQGSGKGTLGRSVSEKYGFQYFEMGAELRKLSHESSPLAQKVNQIIAAGNLVQNEVVMEILEAYMKNLSGTSPVIFDGIPRQMKQAETFHNLLTKLGRDYTGILVDIPKEMALERLTTRRVCSKCKETYAADYHEKTCKKCGGELVTRHDDNPESIQMRIKNYYDETMPVIEKLKAEGKIITLDGTPDIPTVAKNMFALVEKEILHKN